MDQPVNGHKKGTDVGMGVAQSQRPPNVGPRFWGHQAMQSCEELLGKVYRYFPAE